MTTDRKTDAALWNTLRDLPDDLLRADAPVELADAAIREAGGDPAAVGKRGAALVAKLAQKRRLAWHDRARERIKAVANRPRAIRSDLTGSALLAAISTARANLGSEMSAAFRAHNDEDMTEEERRELLADLEAILAMGKDTDGEKP